MNIVPGIICTIAAALSQNPQSLPMEKAQDEVMTARIERVQEDMLSSSATPDSKTFSDENKRANPPVKAPRTSQSAIDNNGRNNNPSRPINQDKHNAAKIAGNLMQNDTVQNGTTNQSDISTQNGTRNQTGTVSQNSTHNQNDSVSRYGVINQNQTAVQNQNNTAQNGTRMQRAPFHRNGTTDPNQFANQNGTTNPNQFANQNMRQNQTQNRTGITGQYQNTVYTTQTADDRYSELKARLDEQFAYMFQLKAELDAMHSAQSAKWEEYNCLRQSYERHLKQVIADWVINQSLMG